MAMPWARLMGAGLGIAGVTVGGYVIFQINRPGRDLVRTSRSIEQVVKLPRVKALLRMQTAIDALMAGRHMLPEKCTELLLCQVLR